METRSQPTKSPPLQWWQELPATLALALPIAAGQVGQMLLGIADSAMVGQLGAVPLAACAFANAVLAIPLVAGFGLLGGVFVRASVASGAGDAAAAARVLRAGVAIAALGGFALAVAGHATVFLFPRMGQEPEVVAEAVRYTIICAWSLIPAFIATALRQFCESLGAQWPAFWLYTATVALNIALNWVFIYGNIGAPALGLEGAGWATLISRIVTVVALAWFIAKAPRFADIRACARGKQPVRDELRQLRILGLPTAFHYAVEVAAFVVAAIMLGWLGAVPLAAHQIAISCAAFTFMVPLGISMASTIRFGHALGAGTPGRCRPIALGSVLLAGTFMTCTATVFLTCGPLIASGFTGEHDVIQLGAALLIVTGIFQIFDGQQVVATGCLRGLSDVKTPVILVFAAYWVLALPLGWLFALPLRFGAVGMWCGLALGLAAAAALLTARLRSKLRRLESKTSA